MLKIFFDISTGFRFSKISMECSVHLCSCPWSGYQNTTSEKIQIHCECAYLDRSYFTEKSWVDTLFMATRVSVPRYRRPRKLKTAWTVEIVNNILSFTDLVKFRVILNSIINLFWSYLEKDKKREEISNNIKCNK